jgi:crossover junction endodeoxyribonuclease RuvC
VRVLGIDPGSRFTGWGVVEERARAVHHVASGTIALGAGRSLGGRLARLHAECERLVTRFAPAAVALERAFVARNVQSALRLGEARGVVLAAVAAAGTPLHEYAPAAVKLAAGGHGRADKAAMMRGVVARLGLGGPLPLDAADALAVALCHLQHAPLARALVAAERRLGAGARPRGNAAVACGARSAKARSA